MLIESARFAKQMLNLLLRFVLESVYPRFEFLTRPEGDNPSGGNGNFLTRLGIATRTLLFVA